MLQTNLIQIPLKSMKRLPLIAIRLKWIEMYKETWPDWKIETILKQDIKEGWQKR